MVVYIASGQVKYLLLYYKEQCVKGFPSKGMIENWLTIIKKACNGDRVIFQISYKSRYREENINV